jgi:signal transduction histidine kinase
MDRMRFWLRWASGLIALCLFAFWSLGVAQESRELQADRERRVQLIQQLQHAQRVLQTTAPLEPAVDKALDDLLAVEKKVEATSPSLATGLVTTRVADLRAAIPEEDPTLRTEARTELLLAVDAMMGALWNEAEAIGFDQELVGLRVQALSGVSVALALIALLLWGLATRRGRQTERLARRLEDALGQTLRASQAKSDFIAMVSHEVRTPLTAILGHAELLEQTPLNERQRDGLAVIQSGGDSLLHLLSDVLDMSRIEAGRLELRNEDFDVEELLDSAVLLFASRAEAKGLELSVLAEVGLPFLLRGDPSRMRQVLLNLISNAIKFTEDGHVRIRAGHQGGALVITVEDSGPGVSEDARSRIFDAFTQAEMGSERAHGGAGLGLTISRRLVEAMNGTLGLESTGLGSRFEVRVPLEIVEPWSEPPSLTVAYEGEDPALARQLAEWGIRRVGIGEADITCRIEPFGSGEHGAGAFVLPVRPAALRRLLERRTVLHEPVTEGFDDAPRILVVDDNAASREVLSQMLRAIGCEVGVADSGVAAVARAQEGWRVVFMDCDMPGMDGLEATRRILGEEPEMAILGLSGHATDDFRRDALRAGMREYLTKPIRLRELRDAIRRQLSD